MRSSVPVSSSSRESVSNQTLTPCSDSSCNGDLELSTIPLLLFQSVDLLETLDVATLSDECCTQKRGDELGGKRFADDLRPEAEDVHVVVLDALMRRIGVVADRGTNPVDLAGGHRRT